MTGLEEVLESEPKDVLGVVEDDFGFYGDAGEDENVEDIHGITDTVTDFTYTGIDYPCLMFRDGFMCEKHKMRVVSAMVKAINIDKDVSLYYQDRGSVYKLGMISGLQVESFISLIGEDNLVGYYDKDTVLEGDRMYVLCSF